MKDVIVDYESDGTPVHLVDVMAKVGEYALKLGMRLEITEDPKTGQDRFRLIEVEPGAMDRVQNQAVWETLRELDLNGGL